MSLTRTTKYHAAIYDKAEVSLGSDGNAKVILQRNSFRHSLNIADYKRAAYAKWLREIADAIEADPPKEAQQCT